MSIKMEDADLRCLEIENNYDDICKILRRFINNNVNSKTFDELNKGGKKASLINVIFKHLDNQDARPCHSLCLDCLRIVSRDKTNLQELIDERKMQILLRMADLCTVHELTAAPSNAEFGAEHEEIVLAADKALCNIVFNSTVCAGLVAHSHAAEGILTRLRMYRELKVPYPVKLFDMKLLFLITALCPDVCLKLKEEQHAVTYLTEALDLILKESKPSQTNEHHVFIEESDVELSIELLKVLFNLIRRVGFGEEDTEEESLWLRLTSILHDLLVSEASPENQEQLRGHTANLLTSVPVAYYGELTPQAAPDLPKELECEGRNVEAVISLVDFLAARLGAADESRNKQEILSPVLTVLRQLARKQRAARKLLKARILPPLRERDVMTRPEEGNSMRAHLCRLLLSPSSIVKDIVADFLFTLCKCNATRMVKYTGFGNAAGLLADRGLMAGGRSAGSSSSYSSDSDSETEEYSKYAGQINPVLGCYEPPRPDPMEGMSDEQKEYEAVQLANMLDKLSRGGLVQPCKIGEDGRPQPVSHVLELQDALPSVQVHLSSPSHEEDAEE